VAVSPVALAVNAALIGLNMALQASQKIEGPRLDSLETTTAEYGTPLIYVYGTRRLEGCPVIFAEPLHEVKRRRKTKGGKYNEYTYFGTWAVHVIDQPADAVTRIWFDRHLVYDATGGGPISPFGADFASRLRIYLGDDDQQPDPRMAATVDAEHGEGSTPAYRGSTYIMFEEVPLEKLGNRLPLVSVEVVRNGAPSFPFESRDANEAGDIPIYGTSPGVSFSPDGTRLYLGFGEDYEIWDVSARSRMIAGTFAAGPGAYPEQGHFGVDSAGNIYFALGLTAFTGALMSFGPDGTGGATTLDTFNAVPTGHVQVVQYGADDGSTRDLVGILLNSLYPYIAYYTSSAFGVVLQNTADINGSSWVPGCYFADQDGGVWVVGAGGTTIYLYCIFGTDTGVGGGTLYTYDTGLATGAAPNAYHYRDANVDHFVVSWNDTRLYTIDFNDGSLTSSAVHFANYKQFQNLATNPASIWL
jgi:hypothetical protein